MANIAHWGPDPSDPTRSALQFTIPVGRMVSATIHSQSPKSMQVLATQGAAPPGTPPTFFVDEWDSCQYGPGGYLEIHTWPTDSVGYLTCAFNPPPCPPPPPPGTLVTQIYPGFTMLRQPNAVVSPVGSSNPLPGGAMTETWTLTPPGGGPADQMTIILMAEDDSTGGPGGSGGGSGSTIIRPAGSGGQVVLNVTIYT